MSPAAGSTISQVPSGGQGAAHVPGRAQRVAHVVQAVEAGDQVVAGARERLCPGDLEADPVGDPGLGGPLAGLGDRAVVVVRAHEGRRRERLAHEHRAGAVPAADVGDLGALLQLGLDAVQRRDPLRDEVGEVAGAEELLAPAEDLVVVLVPAEPGAGPEGLLHPREGGEGAEGQLEGAGQEERAVGSVSAKAFSAVSEYVSAAASYST